MDSPRILHHGEEDMEFQEALFYVGDSGFIQRVEALQLCLDAGQFAF